jgi:tRNA-specific 2-thiouridylase
LKRISGLPEKNLPKVIVGLSGGVDSAVAAYLLRSQGYEVYGATAVLWPGSLCCGDESIAEAKNTAKYLNIPHVLINVIPQFGSQVIQPFIDAYYRGTTPNPCTICNRMIKFGVFFDQAVKELKLSGTVLYATGHYAEVVKRRGNILIKKGKDKRKDQSYMLYNLMREQLQRTIFPLRGLTKDKVRAIAKKAGISVHERAESQDACFVNGDYKQFIQDFSGKIPTKGKFIHLDGTILGEHNGIPFYTLGQRRGLGIAYKEPLYVVAIKPETNEIVVGPKAAISAKKFAVTDCNWLIPPPTRKIVAHIKVRYNSPAVRGIIDPQSGLVALTKSVEAITPGQAAVFYQRNCVIGGGTIAKIKEAAYGK